MNPIYIILIGTSVVLFCILVLKLHAVISLLLAALATGLLTSPALIFDYALHSGLSNEEAHEMANLVIGKRLSNAFGNTSAKVGILIALASIIGVSLMKSGGAERIIRAILSLFGEKKAALALLCSSFLLTIPVFFETVFYLMLPLIKSMGVRNPKKYSLYLMVVIAGGVMAHSLVPPVPGPLFVAKALKVEIGVMMLGGIVIGAITVSVGYFYARWANLKWKLPMRNTQEMSLKDLEQFTDFKNSELPKLWISLLPVLLPIVLISSNVLSKFLIGENTANLSSFQNELLNVLSTVGDPNMALIISATIAVGLLSSRLKNTKEFQKIISGSLSSAGVIILIIASGGVFGQMLEQTGIGIAIGKLASNYQMAILPLAFFITAALRTAQGSATVAMVTAVGVMSGVSSAGLHFHPVYLALVIGCGSKIFTWMNDSAFWVITEMTGMEEKETIRHFSFLSMIMGFTGLIAIMVLSTFFPLI
ncbi:MAG: GntP family permease [Bacteroidota bacterium]